MTVVKRLKNGLNQAIQSPKEIEFDLGEIDTLRIDNIGDTITLRPHHHDWPQ